MKKFKLKNLYLFGFLHGASVMAVPWVLTTDVSTVIKVIVCSMPLLILIWRFMSVLSEIIEFSDNNQRHKWFIRKDKSNVIKMPKIRKR